MSWFSTKRPAPPPPAPSTSTTNAARRAGIAPPAPGSEQSPHPLLDSIWPGIVSSRLAFLGGTAITDLSAAELSQAIERAGLSPRAAAVILEDGLDGRTLADLDLSFLKEVLGLSLHQEARLWALVLLARGGTCTPHKLPVAGLSAEDSTTVDLMFQRMLKERRVVAVWQSILTVGLVCAKISDVCGTVAAL